MEVVKNALKDKFQVHKDENVKMVRSNVGPENSINKTSANNAQITNERNPVDLNVDLKIVNHLRLLSRMVL